MCIRDRPVIFAIVHAETSTGVLQPLEGIGDLCRKNNCLFLVDAVTSLGALELFIDEWKIDLSLIHISEPTRHDQIPNICSIGTNLSTNLEL